MTTAAAPISAQFDMGRVVRRTSQVIGSSWRTLGLLAMPAILVEFLITAAQGSVKVELSPAKANSTAAAPPDLGQAFAMLGWMILILLVTFAAYGLLEAALVRAAVLDLEGDRVTVRASVAAVLRRIVPMVGLSLVGMVGIILGTCLFVVPGILMMIRWAVAVPVLVVEGGGVFNALGRSMRLTQGHGRKLFALGAVYLLLAWIITVAVPAATAGFNQQVSDSIILTWLAFCVRALTSVVQLVIGSAGLGAVYYELRSIRGAGPDSLASVFD